MLTIKILETLRERRLCQTVDQQIHSVMPERIYGVSQRGSWVIGSPEFQRHGLGLYVFTQFDDALENALRIGSMAPPDTIAEFTILQAVPNAQRVTQFRTPHKPQSGTMLDRAAYRFLAEEVDRWWSGETLRSPTPYAESSQTGSGWHMDLWWDGSAPPGHPTEEHFDLFPGPAPNRPFVIKPKPEER